MTRSRRQNHPSTYGQMPQGGFGGFHGGGPEDPLIGSLLEGGYRIRSKIGSGGTASVYLAENQEGAKAAAKVASVRLEPAFMNRLIEREARILRGITHPNIISCIGEGSIGGRSYALLEHLEGVSLAMPLDRRVRLSWSRLSPAMAQICDALGELHGRGMVHRDVKARNVFLQSSGNAETAKLLDLGMVREPDQPDPIPSGKATGTIAYIAPEIILGMDYDQRADIYSAGVLMYSLLCGTVPFSGDSRSVLLSHISEDPISPRDLHPFLEIPYGIDDIVMRALRKKPEDRFDSAAEMKEAILAAPQWHLDLALIDGVSWARLLRLQPSGTDE